jgi:hypothetical protein
LHMRSEMKYIARWVRMKSVLSEERRLCTADT